MPTPVLRSIHVHPVKALRGQSPREAVVEPWGLAGDRRWALIDAAGRIVTQRERPRLALAAAELLPGGGVRVSAPGLEPLTITVPGPAGTTTATWAGEEIETVPAGSGASAWFSTYLGEDVTLVHLDDPAVRRPIDPAYGRPGETVSLADGYPLLLTAVASLDALNSLIARGDRPHEGPLPMNRFRPNLVVDGTVSWAEDGWKRIAVGEVVLRVATMCGRCVVTTTDQATGARGKEPLRSLGRHRRFGGRLVFGQNLVPETPGTVRVGDRVTVLDHSDSGPAPVLRPVR
ncbi:MOSC domain-containing protein [Streptomyces caeni]|uniref:MOSC domain-containing protein n=1 Tax=Streptomyces caeni TaxID=2307231 RepID=A0ABW4IYE5_9ACTN